MMSPHDVAYRMFIRNVADYAEPVLAELAWVDPDIRSFWVEQARAVMSDLSGIAEFGPNAAADQGPGAAR
jgi:hypothetical protein